MNTALKRYLIHLWQSVVFYTLAMMLWGLFRFYGLGALQGVTIDSDLKGTLQILKILRLLALSGILVGIVFANIEFVFEKYAPQKLPMGVRTLFKTILYLLTIIAISTVIKYLARARFNFNIKIDINFWWEDKLIRITIVYILLVSLVFSFIKIATEKFGKGIFIKMLLGKYKKPREEKRIFMFLDLKSSTTIAETLGHFKYSKLIQDCFYDLNEIVPKYAAEIYQYVGDEAVLSWPYSKGLSNYNCVALFFQFQNLLKLKTDYYENNYGLVPEFKAGLHGGKLMVAEVGVVKKELAFHGDVINTSARIQAACNTYGVSILISEKLKNDLAKNNSYTMELMGFVHLKGKQNPINLFTIIAN